jgi:uncharacterized membrane protein
MPITAHRPAEPAKTTAAPPPVAAKIRVAWPHVVAGLAGIGVSLYSVRLHNIVKAGDSACDISDTISCDKVLGSAWAAPFGVPLGIFGALFFGLVILTAISTAPDASPLNEARQRFFLACLGLCGALGLLFVSKVLIGAWCPICLATHAVIAANFVAAVLGLRALNRQPQKIAVSG